MDLPGRVPEHYHINGTRIKKEASMDSIRHRARGISLALLLCGAVPGVVAAAAISCQAILDAAPWAAAIAAIYGVARLVRWPAC